MLVVKIGGGDGLDYDLICDDVAALTAQGQQLVVVHGGSHLTNQVAEQLGHPPQFVTSVSGYASKGLYYIRFGNSKKYLIRKLILE